MSESGETAALPILELTVVIRVVGAVVLGLLFPEELVFSALESTVGFIVYLLVMSELFAESLIEGVGTNAIAALLCVPPPFEGVNEVTESMLLLCTATSNAWLVRTRNSKRGRADRCCKRETETETDRQTNRQTEERQTETETEITEIENKINKS